MRQIKPFSLWIGHIGDARDHAKLFELGIEAVVDLANNEAPQTFARDIVYCRFPVADGGGNPDWILQACHAALVEIVRDQRPTLVFCSLGMSRSPVMVAAALATLSGRPTTEMLADVALHGRSDVSPALWEHVQRLWGTSKSP